MTDKQPSDLIKRGEFGRRKPAVRVAAQPAPKRSNHVALLVMGTLAVGGGAYALMPSESRVPPQPAAPGMAAPAIPPAGTCTSRSSWSGNGSYRSSSWSFSSGDSSSKASAASAESSGGVTRGGFGSFARAFGFAGG
jgi:hypothetical protein